MPEHRSARTVAGVRCDVPPLPKRGCKHDLTLTLILRVTQTLTLIIRDAASSAMKVKRLIHETSDLIVATLLTCSFSIGEMDIPVKRQEQDKTLWSFNSLAYRDNINTVNRDNTSPHGPTI